MGVASVLFHAVAQGSTSQSGQAIPMASRRARAAWLVARAPAASCHRRASDRARSTRRHPAPRSRVAHIVDMRAVLFPLSVSLSVIGTQKTRPTGQASSPGVSSALISIVSIVYAAASALAILCQHYYCPRRKMRASHCSIPSARAALDPLAIFWVNQASWPVASRKPTRISIAPLNSWVVCR